MQRVNISPAFNIRQIFDIIGNCNIIFIQNGIGTINIKPHVRYFSCCSLCTVKCSLLNFEIAVFVSFFLIIIFEIDTFDSGLFQG